MPSDNATAVQPGSGAGKRAPRLVLIDGHSLAFRAFHALPPNLTSPGGELTNAVYGFTTMLLNVLREQQPDYVAVAFDLGRTFRHDMYADYKGHRARMPDELISQVERIKQIVTALNIPIFTAENFEADDVLATLAKQAAAEGVQSLIVTGDRDILQVVDDRIHVLTSGRVFSDTIIYDPQSVGAKYELRPDQLLDLKALWVTSRITSPASRASGKREATELRKYGSLDAAYAHIDEVTPARLKTALEAGRADAELSRNLGRIITDVPIRLDLDACQTQDYDRDQVIALFQDLAFRSLVEKLPPSTPRPASARPLDARATEEGEPGPAGSEAEQMALFEMTPDLMAQPASVTPSDTTGVSDVLMVVTEPALAEVAAQLAASRQFAFDTETTGTDPYSADLVGVSVAWGPSLGQAAYIPLRHFDTPGLPWETVAAALQPAFANPEIDKIAHNISYDLGILNRAGLKVESPIVDTMVAAWLIDPGMRGLGLKDLAWTRLRTEMTRITDLLGTGKTQITMDQVPAAAATAYAGADAAVTLQLAQVLLPEVEEKGLAHLFRDIEMPLAPVLVAMEAAGVKVDVPFLRQMSVDLTARLQKLERSIQELAGYAFNVNSTQQLSDVLFGKLGLPTEGLKKTQAGGYSTAADVLEGLRGRHEIIDLILEQRMLSKLLGTYVDALPNLVNRIPAESILV